MYSFAAQCSERKVNLIKENQDHTFFTNKENTDPSNNLKGKGGHFLNNQLSNIFHHGAIHIWHQILGLVGSCKMGLVLGENLLWVIGVKQFSVRISWNFELFKVYNKVSGQKCLELTRIHWKLNDKSIAF